MTYTVKSLGKAIAGVIGVAAGAVSLGLIPHPFDYVVTSLIGIATALGIYTVPYVPVKPVDPPAVVVPPAV